MTEDVYTLPKGDTALLTPDFKSYEFDCPCKNCLSTQVSETLLLKLQRMREWMNTPLKINSGYRCGRHQKELKDAGYETSDHSQHILGRAADVSANGKTGLELERCARDCGFQAVGVAQSWVHVDLRDDLIRRWTYLRR